MSIYLIYAAILILTSIFFIIMEDKIKALKLTGILTIISSIVLIILMFILKLVITNFVTGINISGITDYLFMKFVYTSLIIFIIGLIEIIISKYLYSKRKVKV